jgi:hypothetical protein
MIQFFFHASLLITVCFVFYWILLKSEKLFKSNRWFLLVGIIFSFALPAIKTPVQFRINTSLPGTFFRRIDSPLLRSNVVRETVDTKLKKTNSSTSKTLIDQESISYHNKPLISLLFDVYCAMTIVFFLLFLVKMGTLYYLIVTNPVSSHGKYHIVNVQKDHAPCSFANYIFINEGKYDTKTCALILLHEKIHANQRHSVDLVLSELLLIVQWYNPFAWLYRKAMVNNLEYLTDEAVLNVDNIDTAQYQMSLLQVCSNKPIHVSLNYNHLLIKKRIIMMNSEKSTINKSWKHFLLLPLLLALSSTFNETNAYKSITNKNGLIMNIANNYDSQIQGNWTATVDGQSLHIHFKDSQNIKSNTDINFTDVDMPDLSSGKDVQFSLKRWSGSIDLTGKFDGSKGEGEYIFYPNKDMLETMSELGVKLERGDSFTFFIFDIKKDLLESLKSVKSNDITSANLNLAIMKNINSQYIDLLKNNGYYNIGLFQIISAKIVGIDQDYITKMKTKYNNLTFNELLISKNPGIKSQQLKAIIEAHSTVDSDK